MEEERGNMAEEIFNQIVVEIFSKWTKATDSRIFKNPKYDKYKENHSR